MSSEPKVDLFHPAQPNIPGVKPPKPVESPVVEVPTTDTLAAVMPPATAPKLPGGKHTISLILVALTLAGIGLSGWAMFWFTHRGDAAADPVTLQPAVGADVPAHHEVTTTLSGRAPVAPGVIAAASALAKPWSSVRFDFRNPVTSEITPSLAVRLPGGELWGISLREPYGTCDMDYVTDLRALKQQYGYAAAHPMVVDSCKSTVFDLAVYGNGPNGMVRGEIVSGSAVRPPIAIKIERHGNDIVAVRSE